jgi:glycosyltransferase involved in cell wall biosynthesis
MIEAMACGTPVIACPCGAAPEIVDDGVLKKSAGTDDIQRSLFSIACYPAQL